MTEIETRERRIEASLIFKNWLSFMAQTKSLVIASDKMELCLLRYVDNKGVKSFCSKWDNYFRGNEYMSHL